VSVPVVLVLNWAMLADAIPDGSEDDGAVADDEKSHVIWLNRLVVVATADMSKKAMIRVRFIAANFSTSSAFTLPECS